jgi:hypothetical protein
MTGSQVPVIDAIGGTGWPTSRKYGGKDTGPDHDFRNGRHELDDQLDGADNTRLHRLSPTR